MARDRNNLSYTESNARPGSGDASEETHAGNDAMEGAAIQYQNANPGMSYGDAQSQVGKASPEQLKKNFTKNTDGSYSPNKRKGD